MADPQSLIDLKEETRDNDFDKRRKALHEKLGMLSPDYSALKMEHPEAPEQDAEAIRRNRNLSKVALIAQSIDALSNVVGMSQAPDWQPVSSPVGQMGVQAYDNLRNLDLDHHNQLKEHGRNVFNIDRANQALDVQQQQADLSTQRSQIENELRDLRTQYEQGSLNARNYADNIRRIQLEARRDGLQWDPVTNTYSELPDKKPEPETPEESLYQQYEIDDRQLLLYDAYKRAEQQVTPDMIDAEGRPLPGTPAMRLAALEKELGTELYLIESIREKLNRDNEAYDPQTDPQVQAKMPAVNDFQLRALATSVINAPDPQTQKKAMTQWYQKTAEMLKARGDVPDDQIPELVEQMFGMMIAELTGAQGGQKPSFTKEGAAEPEKPEPNRAGFGRDEKPKDDETQQGDKKPVEVSQSSQNQSGIFRTRTSDDKVPLSDLAEDIDKYLKKRFPSQSERTNPGQGLDIIAQRVKRSKERLQRLEKQGSPSGVIAEAERTLEEQEDQFRRTMGQLPPEMIAELQSEFNIAI